MYNIINNPEFMIPQSAPDGNYCPGSSIAGDVNEDGMVNVLDVILSVNLILDGDFIPLADMNEHMVVDILDIILIVNIILGLN